ncbi:MAG: hypothetical protein AVDCRST_MAG19-2210, partial [uncultured Thermomicrobiales bacterium]
MRRLLAVPLGLSLVAAAAVVRPGPVVRWLARRHPDVLFSVDTQEPLVALTIDDAPHPALTPAILDVLAAHGARATFFLLGGHVPGNETILRRLVAEGHELGNHLLTDAPSIRLPPDEFERQLRQTHDLLAPFGPVRWFRPGSGWFNRRMLAQLRRHNYRCALGSAYAYDTHIRSTWYVSHHILRHARPGAIIILHDGGEQRRQTLAILG